MASVSCLSTYKERSDFYSAVAEKDANYVGRQIHAARKDLKISLEQFSRKCSITTRLVTHPYP